MTLKTLLAAAVAAAFALPLAATAADDKASAGATKPDGGAEAMFKALDKNKKILRQEVARRVNLKFAPDLRFLRDESFDEAARIDALLRTERVARDTGRSGPAVSEDDNDEQNS